MQCNFMQCLTMQCNDSMGGTMSSLKRLRNNDKNKLHTPNLNLIY